MNVDLEFIVKRLAVELMNRDFTIATAEEYTCGLIGASVASLEYPQRWYKGTVTCYTSEGINKLFGVPLYVIEKNGLVSSQVAQHMALDVLYKYGSNIGIGVIGSIDGYNNDIQICVVKMTKNNMKFSYKKLIIDGKDKGKDLEEIVKESLMLTIELVMEE